MFRDCCGIMIDDVFLFAMLPISAVSRTTAIGRNFTGDLLLRCFIFTRFYVVFVVFCTFNVTN